MTKNWGGGVGGYGMLARKYIAKYVPNCEIEIEVILGTNQERKKDKNHRKIWNSKYIICLKIIHQNLI